MELLTRFEAVAVGWMDGTDAIVGWMDGWMAGWLGGWVDGLVVSFVYTDGCGVGMQVVLERFLKCFFQNVWV